MEAYVRYKRFQEAFTETKLQEFFDKLVTEGWEIIYYKEKPNGFQIHIVALCGKRQRKDI